MKGLRLKQRLGIALSYCLFGPLEYSLRQGIRHSHSQIESETKNTNKYLEHAKGISKLVRILGQRRRLGLPNLPMQKLEREIAQKRIIRGIEKATQLLDAGCGSQGEWILVSEAGITDHHNFSVDKFYIAAKKVAANAAEDDFLINGAIEKTTPNATHFSAELDFWTRILEKIKEENGNTNGPLAELIEPHTR